MSYTKLHLEHYAQTSDSAWSSTPTVLGGYDIKIKNAIGDKRNTFEFKILNINDQYSTFFSPNQKINLYETINGDTLASSDIIMAGVIKSVTKNMNGTAEVLHIKGVDYSEVILSGLVFVDGSGQNTMQVMQLIVNSLNAKNQAASAGQRYNLVLDAPSLKFNTDTNLYDGAAFPVIESAREFYKTGIKVVEKYLSSDYTGDGRYFWYISVDNKLVVRKRTNVISEDSGSPLSIVEGSDCYSVNIGSDIKGVKNFVVWKAGQDPSNKVIMGVKDNPISRVKNGFRPHFLLTHDTVTQPLFDNEQNTAADGTFEVSSKMIVTSIYPYTTNWVTSQADASNAPTVVAGANVVVTDETEWVYAFRREVKWQSEATAQRILDELGNGYLKVSAHMPHNSSFQVGQLIQFNSPRYGIIDKPMRINELDHDINGLTLTLIEDVGTQ